MVSPADMKIGSALIFRVVTVADGVVGAVAVDLLPLQPASAPHATSETAIRKREGTANNSTVTVCQSRVASNGSSADHVDQQEDDRDDEEDVQQSAQRRLRHDAEQPQHDQNDDDGHHGGASEAIS